MYVCKQSWTKCAPAEDVTPVPMAYAPTLSRLQMPDATRSRALLPRWQQLLKLVRERHRDLIRARGNCCFALDLYRSNLVLQRKTFKGAIDREFSYGAIVGEDLSGDLYLHHFSPRQNNRASVRNRLSQ